MRALDAVDTWPVPHAAVAVLSEGQVVGLRGDTDLVFRWASVTKLLTAWATLIAVEERVVDLDEPVGQLDCTVRHLLCHAGGYGFEGAQPISSPGRTRIYSNAGYELLAEHVASVTAMPFAAYLIEAVLAPLDMGRCRLEGSPAKDAVGTLHDLIALAQELGRPRLLHDTTVHEATRVVFPELSGIVPAVGRFDPCPWGLGPEIKGEKSPHWTGSLTSASTFGHFGGAGTFVWVDPEADVICVALTDRDMVSWGMQYWPAFADQVIAELGARPTS